MLLKRKIFKIVIIEILFIKIVKYHWKFILFDSDIVDKYIAHYLEIIFLFRTISHASKLALISNIISEGNYLRKKSMVIDIKT